MKKLFQILIVMLSVSMATHAHAALKVFACEPEWGALVAELAGDKADVYNATTALQDPHAIQARPSLIARARSAALLVCTGAGLEAGWLPLLLRQSGNAAIQPGATGYFEAAGVVPMLEIPSRLDRADGDVHAAGNPHIQTDPHNIARVAQALALRLAQVDAANADHYRARHADFAARWGSAMQRWEKQAQPLKGVAVVAQHQGFPYLNRWLGLKQVTVLEPKPGVEPSSAYLAEVLGTLQQQPAKMVLRAAYNDGRASEWLSTRAQIPVVVLPFTVGGNPQAQDLFGLFDSSITLLLGALQ